jgi:hypothetical protein
VRRRRHAELAAQALREAAVGTQRPGSVAGRGEPGDQPSVSILVERVTVDLPPREIDRLAGFSASLAVSSELLEQLNHLLAVALASRERPLVLETFEQLAATQRQRLCGCVRRQALELAGVDPQPFRLQPDPVALHDEALTELPPQRPQRAP